MRGIRETRKRIGVKKMRKGEKAIRAEENITRDRQKDIGLCKRGRG